MWLGQAAFNAPVFFVLTNLPKKTCYEPLLSNLHERNIMSVFLFFYPPQQRVGKWLRIITSLATITRIAIPKLSELFS